MVAIGGISLYRGGSVVVWNDDDDKAETSPHAYHGHKAVVGEGFILGGSKADGYQWIPEGGWTPFGLHGLSGRLGTP
jgi:hypothetical protein